MIGCGDRGEVGGQVKGFVCRWGAVVGGVAGRPESGLRVAGAERRQYVPGAAQAGSSQVWRTRRWRWRGSGSTCRSHVNDWGVAGSGRAAGQLTKQSPFETTSGESAEVIEPPGAPVRRGPRRLGSAQEDRIGGVDVEIEGDGAAACTLGRRVVTAVGSIAAAVLGAERVGGAAVGAGRVGRAAARGRSGEEERDEDYGKGRAHRDRSFGERRDCQAAGAARFGTRGALTVMRTREVEGKAGKNRDSVLA